MAIQSVVYDANKKRKPLVGHLNITPPCCRVLFPVFAFEDGAPVLVHFDAGNDHLAGVDTNGYGGTVRLVSLDTVDVDDPLLAVDLGHFALTPDVLSTGDSDLIISANGEGAGVVLCPEILGERRGHDDPADGGGGSKVSLAGLAP